MKKSKKYTARSLYPPFVNTVALIIGVVAVLFAHREPDFRVALVAGVVMIVGGIFGIVTGLKPNLASAIGVLVLSIGLFVVGILGFVFGYIDEWFFAASVLCGIFGIYVGVCAIKPPSW